MEFKGPYLMAMQEQAPKLFRGLRKTGQMDAHLQAKSAEAHQMLDELTKDAPRLKSGLPEEPYLTQAKHVVLETLVGFPPE